MLWHAGPTEWFCFSICWTSDNWHMKPIANNDGSQLFLTITMSKLQQRWRLKSVFPTISISVLSEEWSWGNLDNCVLLWHKTTRSPYSNASIMLYNLRLSEDFKKWSIHYIKTLRPAVLIVVSVNILIFWDMMLLTK